MPADGWVPIIQEFTVESVSPRPQPHLTASPAESANTHVHTHPTKAPIRKNNCIEIQYRMHLLETQGVRVTRGYLEKRLSGGAELPAAF